MKRILCLSLVLFAGLGLFVPDTVYATENQNVLSSEGTQQNRTFTGKVTDSNGDPIIGASVLVKSTANGTVTDMNGEFSIQTSVGSTLVISYVGYTKKRK